MPRYESERYSPKFGLQYRVETGSTGTPLQNHGLSVLPSTGNYTIDPPSAGVEKVVAMTAASTDLCNVYTGSTDISFASTAGNSRQAVFDATGETLYLVGINSTSWQVVSNQGTVVFTTGP